MACGDPGRAKCAGTQPVSASGVMALSGFFFNPLVAGSQMASLASLSPLLSPSRHLEGSLAWGASLLLAHQAHRWVFLAGSYSVDQASGTLRSTLAGVPLCISVSQAFDRPVSIVQLPVLACWKRKPVVMAPPLIPDSAVSLCLHGSFSSTGISHHNLPPHIPLIHLHSQQQPLPLDCSRIPKFQLPSAKPSRGPVSLSRVCMVETRTV